MRERRYYSMLSTLISTPAVYKVQLFDMGMLYDEISEFDFFCMMCRNLKTEDTTLLLGDLDLSKYTRMIDTQNNEAVLYNKDNNTIIDKLQYMLITEFIREIHGAEKQIDAPENAMTRKYLIDKERRRQNRHKNDKAESILDPLIVGLVNSGMSPYNYESVLDLPIYTFYESLKSVGKHKNYNHVMQGIYTGTVSLKNINQSEISWMK